MKAITLEWLARAGEDLSAAELLLSHLELTNMVAFHAQQTVEKTMKALLEETGILRLTQYKFHRLEHIA